MESIHKKKYLSWLFVSAIISAVVYFFYNAYCNAKIYCSIIELT
jgi:hypothetical protein